MIEDSQLYVENRKGVIVSLRVCEIDGVKLLKLLKLR